MRLKIKNKKFLNKGKTSGKLPWKKFDGQWVLLEEVKQKSYTQKFCQVHLEKFAMTAFCSKNTIEQRDSIPMMMAFLVNMDACTL